VSALEVVVVLLAGGAAGAINAVVGSGTLITFPVLLALGYAPVVANVSNTIGLVPGSLAGAFGYREELQGQRGRFLRLAGVAAAGGLTGAILLLTLPGEAFSFIVVPLIAIALVLVVLQPRISAALAARDNDDGDGEGDDGGSAREVGPPLALGMFAASTYGGYFGAAQGILYMGILGVGLADHVQRTNALKNVLAALVNGMAAVVFIAVADVAWLPVILIAAGSGLGGLLGARIGRRLSPAFLRGVIVVVGLVAIAQLVL
jgi:uncharacterized membrane protein YfcA